LRGLEWVFDSVSPRVKMGTRPRRQKEVKLRVKNGFFALAAYVAG